MDAPTFLIIGAMKAGTTSLADALSQHPEVFVPAVKEPNSLVEREILTDRGLAAYASLFERGKAATALGEASTGYTKRHLGGALAADHAASVLGPDLKLIYLVRDPIERAVSHAKHLQNSGREFDPTAVIGANDPLCEVSCYSFQTEPWVEAFPPSQLLVIDMRELISDWTLASQKICQHIGVDPLLMPPLGRSNASSDARPAHGLVGSVLRSNLYRSLVQERLPLALRRRLRSGLVKRVESSTIQAADLRWSADSLERLRTEMDAFRRTTGASVMTPTLDRTIADPT